MNDQDLEALKRSIIFRLQGDDSDSDEDSLGPDDRDERFQRRGGYKPSDEDDIEVISIRSDNDDLKENHRQQKPDHEVISINSDDDDDNDDVDVDGDADADADADADDDDEAIEIISISSDGSAGHGEDFESNAVEFSRLFSIKNQSAPHHDHNSGRDVSRCCKMDRQDATPQETEKLFSHLASRRKSARKTAASGFCPKPQMTHAPSTSSLLGSNVFPQRAVDDDRGLKRKVSDPPEDKKPEGARYILPHLGSNLFHQPAIDNDVGWKRKVSDPPDYKKPEGARRMVPRLESNLFSRLAAGNDRALTRKLSDPPENKPACDANIVPHVGSNLFLRRAVDNDPDLTRKVSVLPEDKKPEGAKNIITHLESNLFPRRAADSDRGLKTKVSERPQVEKPNGGMVSPLATPQETENELPLLAATKKSARKMVASGFRPKPQLAQSPTITEKLPRLDADNDRRLKRKVSDLPEDKNQEGAMNMPSQLNKSSSKSQAAKAQRASRQGTDNDWGLKEKVTNPSKEIDVMNRVSHLTSKRRDKNGFPLKEKFTVYSSVPCFKLYLYDFELKVGISGVPNAGRGVFLTYLGASERKQSPIPQCQSSSNTTALDFDLNRVEVSTNYIPAPKRTFSSFQDGCAYLFIGKYGPFEKEDRKGELHFDIKSFLFQTGSSEWSFGLKSEIGGEYPIIDITDDLTGKLHEAARQNIPTYVNETGHNKTLKVNVEASSPDKQPVVNYYVGIDEPMEAGQTVELFVNYAKGYEDIRVRKGYGLRDEKSDDHFPSKLRRNFADRGSIEAKIGKLSIRDLNQLMNTLKPSKAGLHKILENSLKGTCPLCMKQVIAVRRLDWIVGLIHAKRLKLCQVSSPGSVTRMFWTKWETIFESVERVPEMKRIIDNEIVEEICYNVGLTSPKDEKYWSDGSIRLTRSLCLQASTNAYDRNELKDAYMQEAIKEMNKQQIQRSMHFYGF